MAKVTVIIPCFNHGRFVDEAVDSILAQTFADFEIFIVNDGSTEPFTIAKLCDYKKPKTTVWHKENGHLSSARNFGISHANSEYILALDADDRFAPQFLEKAVAILDNEPKVGVVSCWAETFGDEKKTVTHKTGGDVKSFLTHNACAASCLFRKKCWVDASGYDETMKQGYEDWNFWLAVTKLGWLVNTIPEPLFFYRVTESSMVTHSDKMRPELIRRLVQNHRQVYVENIEQVVYELEQQSQKLASELEALRSSPSHRVGRCLTNPLAACRGIFKRLGQKD